MPGPVKASVENGELVLRLPLIAPAQPSSSGRTMLVGSSHGNARTDLVIDGKIVYTTVNAYYFPEDKRADGTGT